MPKLPKEKEIVFTAIEQQVDELNAIGDKIWRYAEVPGEEFKSHDCIVRFLRKKGFDVDESYMGFETAFRADFGEGEVGGAIHPNIGFLCVYDADPFSGHNQGHNLVTVVSLTAALGLQTVIKFATEPVGRVTVIGCPGNETKTSKMTLHKAGGFRNIDFLFAAYPADYTTINPRFIGSRTRRVRFKGRHGKRGDRPWEDADPVNAVVLAYQNVSALRQQFKPDWTVKGVIPEAGIKPGQAPLTSSMEFLLKAPLPRDLDVLVQKLEQCFQAASTATGCTYEAEPLMDEYLSNITCDHLTKMYTDNARLNGFTFHNKKDSIKEPDDISAVSISIPTLKLFYYSGDSSEPGSDEFNRYVGSPEAQFMSAVQGKTLAMLAVDLMKNEENMRIAFEEHHDKVVHDYNIVLPPSERERSEVEGTEDGRGTIESETTTSSPT